MFLSDLVVSAIPFVIPAFLILSGLYNWMTPGKGGTGGDTKPKKKGKSEEKVSEDDMTSG